MKKKYLISEITSLVGGQYTGEGQIEISGLTTLLSAQKGDISFFSNTRYKHQLKATSASAVLVSEQFKDICPVPCIVVNNPYAAYAMVSHLFKSTPQVASGIHPTAYVDALAKLDPSVAVGPHSAVYAGAVIGKGTVIGSGVVLREGVQIGEDCVIHDNVTLYHDVIIKDRVTIHSGAVIGADGFGFALAHGHWKKIAQIGRVIIYSDVEVGANTTIDRGALEDTIIGEGVKLDNQIQIGHNVSIGAHTVIAGCVAIAGSTQIGKYCVIGGAACIGGHLQIADGVTITAMSGVSNSLKTPGVYSSGSNVQENEKWKRNAVRLKNINTYVDRLLKIEKTVKELEDKWIELNNEFE